MPSSASFRRHASSVTCQRHAFCVTRLRHAFSATCQKHAFSVTRHLRRLGAPHVRRRPFARSARHAGCLVVVLLLAACGETPAGQALRGAAPAAPVAVTVQGPALVMTAPRQAVLRPVAGMAGLWRSEDGVAVQLEHGRAVATAGLGPLLMATRFEDRDPLADPRALVGREVTARRSVDLSGPDRDPAGMRFGVALACTLRGTAEDGWVRVEERCTGAGLAFTNHYRAAPDGRIVESEQWVGESVTKLTLRVPGI